MLEISKTTKLVMTSLELVDFINEQRINEDDPVLLHKNFLAKVPNVLGFEPAEKLAGLYKAGNGQMQPCYIFQKREACLMAMSYSYDLQAKVFDRMTELETKKLPALPNYQEALRQLADQLDITSKQAILLEIQQPAVDFVDRYVEAKSSKCLSDVAKLLKHKPQSFFKLLSDNDVIFKRGGSWIPYQRHIDIGRFTVTTGVSNGHAFDQTRVEPDGIVWLAKMFPA